MMFFLVLVQCNHEFPLRDPLSSVHGSGGAPDRRNRGEGGREGVELRRIRGKVADCSSREFTYQSSSEMSVSDYIDYWLGLRSEERLGCNVAAAPPALLYLKDWHFVKEYPEYAAYTTPSFFIDDWLNLYLDSRYAHRDSDDTCDRGAINCADYRFVYMGPKGTWTPLHADVFRSYSWSANVCGKKHWYLLPPSQQDLIFDRNLKNSVHDVRDDVSETKFPRFKEAVWLECVQEQNEIIFVPSGWYHQVQNLEDTISINHNWFNAFNLSCVWKLLEHDYIEAVEYIEDIRHICDDFEGLCQRNLAANTGMNFHDFFTLLVRFALSNSSLLLHRRYAGKEANDPETSRRLISNLASIQSVAVGMQNAVAFGPVERAGEHRQSPLPTRSGSREMLQDPELHELMAGLARAYGIPDVAAVCAELPEDLLDCCCDCPDDLFNLIDCVIRVYQGSNA